MHTHTHTYTHTHTHTHMHTLVHTHERSHVKRMHAHAHTGTNSSAFERDCAWASFSSYQQLSRAAVTKDRRTGTGGEFLASKVLFMMKQLMDISTSSQLNSTDMHAHTRMYTRMSICLYRPSCTFNFHVQTQLYSSRHWVHLTEVHWISYAGWCTDLVHLGNCT